LPGRGIVTADDDGDGEDIAVKKGKNIT